MRKTDHKSYTALTKICTEYGRAQKFWPYKAKGQGEGERWGKEAGGRKSSLRRSPLTNRKSKHTGFQRSRLKPLCSMTLILDRGVETEGWPSEKTEEQNKDKGGIWMKRGKKQSVHKMGTGLKNIITQNAFSNRRKQWHMPRHGCTLKTSCQVKELSHKRATNSVYMLCPKKANLQQKIDWPLPRSRCVGNKLGVTIYRYEVSF